MVCPDGPARAAQTYTIDAVISLTGTAAFAGADQQNALQVYERVVNASGGIRGADLHFEIHDDQSSPQLAVQVTNQILSRPQALVIGASVSADCLAMVPLVVNGPVSFCLSPSLYPARNSFVFASATTTDSIVSAMVRYLRKTGRTKIGIIAATDASGNESLRASQRAISLRENADVQYVAIERFNPTDVSLTAQLSTIKSALPQAIIVFGAGSAFGTVLRGLQDAGIDLPIMTSAANTSPTQLVRYGSSLPRELLFNGSVFDERDHLRKGPLKDACDELVRAYARNHVPLPNSPGLAAWDAARIAVASLRALGVSATAVQVRDSVEALHAFAGVYGMYDFRSGDQHGLTESAVVMSTWDRARKAVVAVSSGGGIPLPSR